MFYSKDSEKEAKKCHRLRTKLLDIFCVFSSPSITTVFILITYSSVIELRQPSSALLGKRQHEFVTIKL